MDRAYAVAGWSPTACARIPDGDSRRRVARGAAARSARSNRRRIAARLVDRCTNERSFGTVRVVQWTAEHQMFRKTVREFVDAEIDPHVEDWEADGHGSPPRGVRARWASWASSASSTTPPSAARAPTTPTPSILGEELGRVDTLGLAMATGVQTDMATPSLARFGSDELKARYLAPACRGEMVASIAVTEADAGSDVAGLRTRAVRDGDECVINGSKLYITNGTQADWLCLLARTSDEGGYRGMSQFVVPTDRPGFSRQPQARQAGHALVRHRRADLRRGPGAGRQPHRRRGPGLPAADEPVPERADDRRLQHRSAPSRTPCAAPAPT